MVSQRPAKASAGGSRLAGSTPAPSAQFGFTVHGGYCNIVSIGRTVPAPLYFMRRDGRPVMRWAFDGLTPEHGEFSKDKERVRRDELRRERREAQS